MNTDQNVSLFPDHLPPLLAKAFDDLCDPLPQTELGKFQDEIQLPLQNTQLALSRNEFLDIETAQNIASILIRLFENYNSFSPKHQSLIVGAARYFIQDKDIEPDTGSVLGFDDDIMVLNYVLDVLQLPELKMKI